MFGVVLGLVHRGQWLRKGEVMGEGARRVVFLLSCVALIGASGCATVMSGGSQQVRVDSNPQGATILVNGAAVGMTPGAVAVRRGRGTSVVVRKKGFQDQPVPLGTTMNPIFWGNIILGGTIGSIVDFATGAYLQYSPDSYYVRLVSDSSDANPNGTEPHLTDEEFRVVHYVLTNYTELLAEMAAGEGTYLEGLTSLSKSKRGDLKNGELVKLLKRLRSENLRPPQFAEAVASAL